ncbi:hypothetical protein GCM10017687_84900 [Streptomyces echinatus]
MAHPARLHVDEHLTGSRIGDDDRPHLHGCALLRSDYGTDLVWHDKLLCCCALHDGLRDGEHIENAVTGPSRGAR